MPRSRYGSPPEQLLCGRQDCIDAPRWDVIYELPKAVSKLPWGRKVCDAHLAEMREGERRGAMKLLEVTEL